MMKTNLKKRIIPIILIDNFQVVATRNFGDNRVFGNLEQTIEIFNRREVDEIIVLDISCSKNNQTFDDKILRMMSKNTMMPFSYGGGIKTLADIEKCLKNGCDKVVINNYIKRNNNFLLSAVNEFGRQAITVSIDYYNENNKYFIYDHAISKKTKIKLFDYLKLINKIGCGEIIVTSVNADGFLNGYDLKPIKKIRDIVNFPIIVNGGCGSPKHMLKALKFGGDACGAGSIFYYTQYSYRDIKDHLKKNKINVR
jgi:imidazole glycerol-phosphate synthase subunit HisF